MVDKEHHHHVSRIDIEQTEEHPDRHPTHGWQVRVRRDGKRHSRFFSDSKYDGKESALKAAIEYRDQLLDDLPEPAASPRKAWSNTGVVGLSVRDKKEAEGEALYVHINWINKEGKRRAASFSVNKWGLRRALWNGCLRLYRERQAAGYVVDEPHEMFAKAQKPFADRIQKEIAEERKEERERQQEEAFEKEMASPEMQAKKDEDALQNLESALFG